MKVTIQGVITSGLIWVKYDLYTMTMCAYYNLNLSVNSVLNLPTCIYVNLQAIRADM